MCPGVGTTPMVVPARESRSPGSQHPAARARPPRRCAAATWAPKCAPQGSAASAWSPWWWVTSTATHRRRAPPAPPPRRPGGRRRPGPGRPAPRGRCRGHRRRRCWCRPGSSARRVGGEHAGDQRLEVDRPRHLPGRGQGPGGARVGGRCHDRHASPADSPTRARPLASGPCAEASPSAVRAPWPPPSSCSPPAAASGDDGDSASSASSVDQLQCVPESEPGRRRDSGVLHAGCARLASSSSPRIVQSRTDPASLPGSSSRPRPTSGGRAAGRDRRRLGRRSPAASSSSPQISSIDVADPNASRHRCSSSSPTRDAAGGSRRPPRVSDLPAGRSAALEPLPSVTGPDRST